MFSNKTKDCCSKVVGVISVLSGLVGLAMCAYSFLSFSGGELPDKTNLNYEFNVDANEAIGYLAGIAGALALLVGVLGCFAVTCKKPCISGTFCIFSFLIGTLALITGAIVFGLDWDEVKTNACEL